jgi:hypothetical protein
MTDRASDPLDYDVCNRRHHTVEDAFEVAAERLHHMQLPCDVEDDGFQTVDGRTPIKVTGTISWTKEPVETPSGYQDGNPKTAQGAKKPDLSVVPPAGILHMSLAMMQGAEKYGPFNWRENSVAVRVYVAAIMRHALEYLDGEDFSADSVAAGLPVHNLGHVMACCAILLDAYETGNLIDNRPRGGAATRMIEAYNDNKRFS